MTVEELQGSSRSADLLQDEIASLRKRIAELEDQTALRESQERFHALVAVSAQIIWTANADGEVVEDSPSWRAFTGQTWDEYKGAGSLNAVHPDDRERMAKLSAETIRTRTPLIADFRLRHHSGEWRWTNVRGVPLFHPDGSVRGWVGMNTDITAQKAAEEQERERSLQTLADSIPQLAWMANADGSIFWYNRRWYEYTGTTPEQMQGWGWQSVHDPEHLSAVLEAWRKAIVSGEPLELEFPLRAADGSFRWFLTRVVPVRDPTGVISRWYGTNTDIDVLRRANQDLEQFAFAASHDLQEPLRMVSTFTQMLARKYRGKIDAEADKFIAFAVDGARRMGHLLDGLLQYSRAGTSVEKASVANSSAVFKQTLETLKLLISDNDAQITNDPLPPVRVAPVHLTEIFQNLLQNAIKYRSRESPRIHVSARQEGDWISFGVADNGIGIQPEYAEHVFGVFKRLHQDRYGGTGMGLAICKRIVERGGGRIWVEPAFGGGSRFCFTLPAVIGA